MSLCCWFCSYYLFKGFYEQQLPLWLTVAIQRCLHVATVVVKLEQVQDVNTLHEPLSTRNWWRYNVSKPSRNRLITRIKVRCVACELNVPAHDTQAALRSRSERYTSTLIRCDPSEHLCSRYAPLVACTANGALWLLLPEIWYFAQTSCGLL